MTTLQAPSGERGEEEKRGGMKMEKMKMKVKRRRLR